MSRLLSLLALFLALVSSSPAQVNFGRISGAVTDSGGAVIPDLQVMILNEATGVQRTATTNESGYYVAPNLPPGKYSVKVELAGFQPVQKTGMELVADGRITADFTLQIASGAQRVDVISAAGEEVNVVSGELARVVDTQQVQDLALNGRNYTQLADLIPGSALTDEDQMALTTSISTGDQSINGSRLISSHLMVDGAFNMDSGSNGSQVNNVGVDFIREVNIKTSNFSAEYGRNSGAAINVITRGGANEFHGGALEFLRNDALDARNFFSPSKAKLRFNDFGWNLGGPIVKNRLFFFGGQEWKKIRQETAPRRTTIPTRAERLGDFSGRSGDLFFPGTSTPVPGRNLSASITAEGRAIAKIYDRMEQLAVSYVDTSTANNAVFQFANPFDWREDMARIDFVANDKHSLYGRYIHDTYNLVDPFSVSGLPTVPINRVRPGYSYQLTHTWTLSPSTINEARGAATWHGQRRQVVGDTWRRDAYGFTYPQIFNGGPLEEGIPAVSIPGFTAFSGPNFVILSPTADISFADNLTWIKGNHTIKTGLLVIRNRKDQNGRAEHAGNIAFSVAGNPNTTGNALADALLGNYRTFSEANDDPIGFFRFTQTDAYVQDSWKVNRRLSVEFGVRYQFSQPLYTQANNVTNFDPSRYNPAGAVTVTAGGLIVPGSGNPFNGLVRAGDGVPADELGRVPGATTPQALSVPAGAPRGFYDGRNLLAPRFSFAWSPSNESKTAIRGGAGMFYDHPDGNIFFPAVNNPPYLQSVQFENGNMASPTGGKPAAQAPLGTITAIDPNLDTPYSIQYSLSVQRELPRGFLAEAAYVSNLGRHLLRQPDINQATFEALTANAALPSSQRVSVNALRPYKGYSAIRMRLSDSTSNYHALQLYTTKRTGDLVLTGGYTWSKVLTDASTENDATEDPFNRRFNYGPATFDRRHIVFATYSYNLPFARNWTSAFARHMVSGWEFSGMNRFQSGAYFTAVANTSIGSRRADYIGGSVDLDGDVRSVAKYFNTAAFRAAPDGRRGSSGVGNIQGPSMFLWDVSLRKVFSATERLKIRIQADMFNLLNHPNFRSPTTDVSAGDFGAISAAGPARNVQFGAKLMF
jgi:hypothetical protein